MNAVFLEWGTAAVCMIIAVAISMLSNPAGRETLGVKKIDPALCNCDLAQAAAE